MARVDEALTVREAVLLVIDAAGGEVDGRTAVQKLCYFAGIVLNEDLGHRPHYYGPYSRAVEAALGNEAFAGDLEETSRPFASRRGGRTYHYELTEQGRELVTEIREKSPEPASRIDMIVKRLRELVPDLHQRPLSLAAKVDLIVVEQGGATPQTEIPKLAHGLGWQVSDEDVESAVQTLVGLGRLSSSPSAAA